MTAYNFGDIVLIGFPHTDFQGISKRPALVLYDANDQDVLVARITTQAYNTDADYTVKQWKAAGLLAPSYVRLGKMATIEKQFILRQIGSLDAEETALVKDVLKNIFRMKRE